MPDQSFTITIENLKLEKAAIEYMKRHHPGYFSVTNKERKHILDLLELPHTFLRAFDMVHVPRFDGETVTTETIDTHISEITLIELKGTRKLLPTSPSGFFFGATRNEWRLARLLGDKFKFCFVCLHPDSPSAIPLTLSDLKQIIRTRRVQYQINL